jgi:hypothetical protein
MDPNYNQENTDDLKQDRREALQKLGRFAAYAAPFTVLALSKKGAAATGHGPHKGGA